MSKELTKEQMQELEIIATEIEIEARKLRLEYEKNPSEESGSVVVIHQYSEFIEDEEE